MISEELGYKLEKVELSMLGRAKKVSVSKDDTIFLDGAGDKAAITERCEQIREAVDRSTSDYDKCAFLSSVGFLLQCMPGIQPAVNSFFLGGHALIESQTSALFSTWYGGI